MPPTDYFKIAPGHDNTDPADLLGLPQIDAALWDDEVFYTPLADWADEEGIELDLLRVPKQVGFPNLLVRPGLMTVEQYEALITHLGGAFVDVTVYCWSTTENRWLYANGRSDLTRPNDKGRWAGYKWADFAWPITDLEEFTPA
ncbi:MAG TPA: hypothetical protein PKD09_17910 [Aggregatilinea sp.]|uniref:hypothetical protein n=1 Tax=Aggregatilinea sp. TaxID=2806333 RepID=UPI002CDAED21|nr:hypothetical protein [Aggregatilinea sp.]HML23537.1 hypothetical protein [Aggregatilinea sp.]